SFNGQWFYARPYAERSLKTLFKSICENVGIEIGDLNISNHSGRKTAVQVLKELGYSDSIVMSITRHKTQQGLYSYERSKSVLQHEGLSGFLSALEIVGKSSNLIGNDNSQQDIYNREVLLNESFSEHIEDNIELHDTDNIESHDTDNIEPHDTDNIEPHNAENTSVENSFRSAKELLELNKNNKAVNLFENRYPSISNVLQELTIQASNSSHNQT
ncbi:26276_t:CDS:2, partial [Gigaspora rosea]